MEVVFFCLFFLSPFHCTLTLSKSIQCYSALLSSEHGTRMQHNWSKDFWCCSPMCTTQICSEVSSLCFNKQLCVCSLQVQGAVVNRALPWHEEVIDHTLNHLLQVNSFSCNMFFPDDNSWVFTNQQPLQLRKNLQKEPQNIFWLGLM